VPAARVIHEAALGTAEHRKRGELRQGVVAAPRVHADDHVFERGQIFEEPDVLKRARDAQRSNPMRRQTSEFVRLKPCVPGLHRHVTRDEVDQRRLAGAVGPDEAVDGSLLHLQRHPVDGVNPAEVPLDVIQAKEHGHLDGATTRA
jgi:hypothetical protein